MKRFVLSALLLAASAATFAQTTTAVEKDPIKKIEVTGTAELEVVPDELYFTISLKEYFKDEKNQKDKIVLETLEKQLIEAVKSAGLPKENLSISGVTGYREWTGKKKPQHFLAGKQFQLKLSNANNINELMSKVDDRGVEYVNMSRVEHSKKEEFRRQVKVNALKAAKEKAGYLLESIGEKLGEVLEIHEVEEGSVYPMYKQAQYNVRMMAADAAPEGGEALEYQKIKYSYRMNATFRIK
ncbi:SIMPL domain-containing protein [Runella salmonicolor]|uniref:SIMPL domain-containing protein n=1 Tax=Runella salmonicolor TaxID=2950278 RepID=A0ABT1FR50_9BACT|nr:SIMPL domain-containing protein [Runella salmonicolor]MCP1384241.1 SIMPL domain-containing protein [Runella salmonicolor]